MSESKRTLDEIVAAVPAAAIDARALVPVSDEIGGVVLYIGGRPAYYVLNGEWFAALPEPRREGPTPGVERTTPAAVRRTFDVTGLVSTS